jgi:transcriptional regulator with XRE-family HTH domain
MVYRLVSGTPMTDALQDLGPLIVQRRADLGISVREASAQSKVPVATLSRIEQGRTPDLTTFKKLVEWLGLPPERFFKVTERSHSTPDIIGEHLRLDPSLSPADAGKIADFVRTMYESLRGQEQRVAVHLRTAKTFDPQAMRLLANLLSDMQSAIESSEQR